MSSDPNQQDKVQESIKSDCAPRDPLLIFTNAISYHLAAEILHKQPHKSLFLFTTHVCQSFALELYVKCLRQVRGLKWIKKHEIPKLLIGLGEDDLAGLNRHLFKSVSQHGQYVEYVKSGIDFDIDSIAKRSSDTFERIRYWHELVITKKDDKGYAGNPGLGGLCDAFRDYLFELHPHWYEKVDNFRIRPFDNRDYIPPRL